MRREEYNELEIEIIEFDCEDVIRTSPPDSGDGNTSDEGWA